MQFESTLIIPMDHPAFAGHFPGSPIVPGVVLLDAAVYAAQEVLAPRWPDHLTCGAHDVCQIGTAKFLSPVGLGESLTLSGELAASGWVHFNITSGSRKVATGTLMFSTSV